VGPYLIVGGLLAAGALSVGAALIATRHPSVGEANPIAPVSQTAPVAPPGDPPPVPAPVATTTRTPLERAPRPVNPARVERVAPRPAHLSIICDVHANLFVDGSFAGEAPLEAFALAAGRHVVRAEGLTPGLRVLPKEETVTLSDGEHKTLRMELQ
jgi:hypothetical protein